MALFPQLLNINTIEACKCYSRTIIVSICCVNATKIKIIKQSFTYALLADMNIVLRKYAVSDKCNSGKDFIQKLFIYLYFCQKDSTPSSAGGSVQF